MRRYYPTCPRCGCDWARVPKAWPQWVCVGKCGMVKNDLPLMKGVAYVLTIGGHSVYWTYWDDGEDRCVLQSLVGKGISLDPTIPFDVDEDTIKLYMVFS